MKIEELKIEMEKLLNEWVWCRNNGIVKSEFGVKEYSKVCMDIRCYDGKEVKFVVVFNVNWGWGELKVNEIIDLEKLVFSGSGGLFVSVSEWCKESSDWKSWRFVIEKDEDCNEDGFSVDGDSNRVCYNIGGMLSLVKGR
jgi:hypothetical protein